MGADIYEVLDTIEGCINYQNDTNRFQAAIHGVKLKDSLSSKGTPTQQEHDEVMRKFIN